MKLSKRFKKMLKQSAKLVKSERAKALRQREGKAILSRLRADARE